MRLKLSTKLEHTHSIKLMHTMILCSSTHFLQDSLIVNPLSPKLIPGSYQVSAYLHRMPHSSQTQQDSYIYSTYHQNSYALTDHVMHVNNVSHAHRKLGPYSGKPSHNFPLIYYFTKMISKHKSTSSKLHKCSDEFLIWIYHTQKNATFWSSSDLAQNARTSDILCIGIVFCVEAFSTVCKVTVLPVFPLQEAELMWCPYMALRPWWLETLLLIFITLTQFSHQQLAELFVCDFHSRRHVLSVQQECIGNHHIYHMEKRESSSIFLFYISLGSTQ